MLWSCWIARFADGRRAVVRLTPVKLLSHVLHLFAQYSDLLAKLVELSLEVFVGWLTMWAAGGSGFVARNGLQTSLHPLCILPEVMRHVVHPCCIEVLCSDQNVLDPPSRVVLGVPSFVD